MKRPVLVKGGAVLGHSERAVLHVTPSGCRAEGGVDTRTDQTRSQINRRSLRSLSLVSSLPTTKKCLTRRSRRRKPSSPRCAPSHPRDGARRGSALSIYAANVLTLSLRAMRYGRRRPQGHPRARPPRARRRKARRPSRARSKGGRRASTRSRSRCHCGCHGVTRLGCHAHMANTCVVYCE